MDRCSSRLRVIVASGVLAGLFATAIPPSGGAGRHFYDDDPIAREPETQDASGAKPWDIPLAYDLVLNLFTQPGDGSDIRARNVNTIDEVPDSSWFTNRILARPVSIDEAVRGPNTIDGPAPGPWTIIATKSAGMAPGFTVRDARHDIWFVSFDGAGQREAATAAIAVAMRLFWTLGYYQIESYLSTLQRENLRIAESARVTPPSGQPRPMRMEDVDRVLARAARSPDGSFRVLTGRAVPGKVLGGFRYFGTRPDDPNDIVPHEHRRELRALKVFGAWTNLVDMKAGNTLDTLITQDGRSIVRHYLQDVGSTFGTGAIAPREWDEGHESLFEGDATLKRLASLNFWLRPWQTTPYVEYESIGRFEGDQFEPEQWKSRVPAAAVLRARGDDTFWAARRVAAFSDELIRAIVHTGQFSDRDAEAHLAAVLIKRRDKIARVYLPAVNPLVNPRLEMTGATGSLTFDNAAVAANVAAAPSAYRAAWSRFDNTTGETQPIGETRSATPALSAPAGLPTTAGSFIEIAVSAASDTHRSWQEPVRLYFRRIASGWKLVGLRRLPDGTPATAGPSGGIR
jgi:hypothetical protein